MPTAGAALLCTMACIVLARVLNSVELAAKKVGRRQQGVETNTCLALIRVNATAECSAAYLSALSHTRTQRPTWLEILQSETFKTTLPPMPASIASSRKKMGRADGEW